MYQIAKLDQISNRGIQHIHIHIQNLFGSHKAGGSIPFGDTILVLFFQINRWFTTKLIFGL